ncbi:MAG: PASTA domain-containing protein [Clostridia bacterium]|nr:PASTA domain-containing protein [Clostridia bacterium]
MISSDNLCMSCMREIGNSKQCPYCGYHAESTQIPPYLPVRTVIVNRYLVGKMLEYNGEGATYIGWDLSEKKAVKIREFIPDSFTARTTSSLNLQVMRGSESIFAELRQDFVELWTKLAKLKGLSALISVTNVVDDYGTSYAIYDHFEGITLREFLLRNKEGYIAWDKARQLLMPILSTLSTLHSQGIIHRGISPSTLIIATDGKIKITGFCLGAARTARSDLNSQLFEGYSAIEQYGFDGSQGTWTDIYSFGAVLYRTLIGSDPISAKERMTNDRLMVPGKFAETLPAYVINGLINALQILPEDRTRTVEQLRAELSASPTAAAVSGQYQRPSSASKPVPPSQKSASGNQSNKKSRKGGAQVVVTTAVISLTVGLILFIILSFTVFRDKINFSFDSDKTTAPSVSQTQAEEVVVPDFREKSYLSIESNPVFYNNFKFKEEPVFNEEIAKGYVVTQSIEPNSTVPKGTLITLYVSKGKEQIVLPDVMGSDYEEAAARLEELGFKCERTETSEGNYRENEVVSMAPLSGKTYSRGTTVYLRVFVPETEVVTNEFGEIIENEIPENDIIVPEN